MSAAAAPLLDVRALRVVFTQGGRHVTAVDGISWRLTAGQTLAIVGESGAGKSTGCRALLGLLPPSAQVTGSAMFAGTELLDRDERSLRALRGKRIALVSQDPGRGLNPIMRIGEQIAEAVRMHQRLDRHAARQHVTHLLHQVRLRTPDAWYDCYPHQLSGGMRHRVLLAISLAGAPEVLFADEATRSLDVTTQVEVLRLLRELQRQRGLAIVLVSHDPRLVAGFADEVLVLRGGRVVEQGSTRRVVTEPGSGYTRTLVTAGQATRCSEPAVAALPIGSATTAAGCAASCGPRSRVAGSYAGQPSLLSVRSLQQRFLDRGRIVCAVDGVSFDLAAGESLGLVGETGSGKTTLARSLLQLPRPAAGQVLLRGIDLVTLRGRALQRARRSVQMIFQDPFTSLDPCWRVGAIVEEPLRVVRGVHRAERRRQADHLLDRVGLAPERYRSRRPRELSGGECQRIAIARALAARPELLVCDEAVSSLDGLTRTRVMMLFEELREERGLSFLFISHDLALVTRFCDRIAVLYRGRLCEIGPTERIVRQPAHPYTATLLAADPALANRIDPAHAPGAHRHLGPWSNRSLHSAAPGRPRRE
ncbi:MAG: ABC transporter ATP-binding protein [Gammaproteobacteria bacterium]|nr:ABC transporter ATP-binding protein [Gammaproteobacteria bacterium]